MHLLVAHVLRELQVASSSALDYKQTRSLLDVFQDTMDKVCLYLWHDLVIRRTTMRHLELWHLKCNTTCNSHDMKST